MLHLLPQYQKNKVIKEYRIRLAAVLLSSILLVIIMFAVFTLPTFMRLYAEKRALIAQKESYLAIINTGAARSGEGNLDIWKAVDALKPFGKTLTPLLFLDALASPSSGIRIDGYALAQTSASEPVTVTLNGVARTREDVSAYAKLLNDRFGGVKLPLSSLVKQSDISFDFRFQVTYDKALAVVQGKTATTTATSTTN